jgi:hypothetical protein
MAKNNAWNKNSMWAKQIALFLGGLAAIGAAASLSIYAVTRYPAAGKVCCDLRSLTGGGR